jgi:hypothetical protein
MLQNLASMYRQPETIGDPKPEKSPRKRAKRIKPVSEKRSHELGVYKLLRKVLLEEQPICQVCKRNKSTQCHHKAGREGKLLTQWTNLLAVCHDCHQDLTIHSKEAIENGYSEFRNR